jgi:hypothetical protein
VRVLYDPAIALKAGNMPRREPLALLKNLDFELDPLVRISPAEKQQLKG